jgi:hypothetical protein
MITAAPGGDYNAASLSRTINHQVVRFDFLGIVSAFDQARGAASTFSNWSMAGVMDANYQGGSNTEALGGDAMWKYGTQGNMNGVLLPTMRQQLLDVGNAVPQLYYQS